MNSPASSVIAFDLPRRDSLSSEADAPVVAIEETAVGDRDAVRIAAEIIENLTRSAEGTFGVDNPVDAPQRRKTPGEGAGSRSGSSSPKNFRNAVFEGGLQTARVNNRR
jgi:hypothetical protein